MAYRKILVPFQEEASAEKAFRAAVALGRESKAHIEAAHVRQVALQPVVSAFPGAMSHTAESIAFVEAAANEASASLKALFDRLIAELGVGGATAASHRDGMGVTAHFDDARGMLPFDLAVRGRSADISVYARPDKDAPFYLEGLIEEALFQSGRPVYVAAGRTSPDHPKRAVIAWNGSSEAATATAAALPALERADEVVVLSIGALDKTVEGISRVVDYLRLHGVAAREATVDRKGDAAAQLLAEAHAFRADLIVMGAYSHSRWRELVLGGFTKHMLGNADVPLLMAH